MAGTLIKSVMLKITADDGDTESKLAKISAQADELARKHPDLTPRINTAAASAKLRVLKAELNDTGKEADETGSRFGALGGALNLFVTGGLSRGFAEMGTFQKALFALNVATGVGEPLVAGLAVAAGGLAAGFLSAGAGVGVFGEVAKGVYSDITTNLQAYNKASLAIASGDTGKKLVADNKALAASLVGLTSQQKNLVYATSDADVQWHNFTVGATAGVASVLVPALAMVPKALALITPFLAPVEAALRGIVAQVSAGLSSGGLKSFIGDLAGNAGPAITKIATAIGHVVVGIGGILKAFMPVSQTMLSGIDKITAKFAEWGKSLPSHSGFQSLMEMAKTDAPLVVSALQKLGSIAKIVGSQMSSMTGFGNSRQFLQVANAVLQFADALLKAHPGLVNLILYAKLAGDGVGKLKTVFSGIGGAFTAVAGAGKSISNLSKGMKDSEAAASDATGAWGTFGGKISNIGSSLKTAVTAVKEWSIWSKIAGAATKIWTGIQIAFDAVMDANPIMLVVIAITLIIGAIVLLAVKFKPVRDFFKQAWHDIVQWTDDAWHGIEAAFKAVVKAVSDAVGAVINFVKAHWPLIVGIFTGPIGLLVAFVVTHWHQITTETGKLVDGVVSFFKSLPGKIMSALSALPGQMLAFGAHIISMLASGIRSAIGDVTGAIGSVVSEVWDHIPHSPARKGPLSGAGDPMISGGKIGARLAAGMTGSTGMVQAAAAHIARAAGVTSGASQAGGGQVLNVDFGGGSGDELLAFVVAQLRQNIRVSYGGDVQRWATGR